MDSSKKEKFNRSHTEYENNLLILALAAMIIVIKICTTIYLM